MKFSGGYGPGRLSGTGRCWGLVVLLASALLVDASFAQAPSGTAKLVEVRVGKHPGYTRVVFETDVPTTYEVIQEGGELRVRLSAQGKAGTIAARSPLVRAVQLQPGSGGTVAQVQLAKGAVNVKPMVLRNPPRIVLDLTPKPVAVAEAPPATAPAAAPPKPAPRAAPAPAPTAEGSTTAAAAPRPAAEPPATKPAPSAGDASSQAAAAVRAPGAAAGSRDPVAKAPAPPPDSAAGAPVGHPEDAAARRERALARIAGRKANSVEIVQPERRAKAPPPGPRPAPPPERSPDVRPVAPVGTVEEGGGLIGLLTSPTVLAGEAGLVALIGGLLFVRRRGMADGEASPFADDSPFAVDSGQGDEQPVAEAAYQEGEATGFETELSHEDGQASIFDVPEEDIPDDDKDDAPISAAVAAAGAAPFVSASGSPTESAEEAEVEESVMRLVQDLERRVAHMESRMEELSDTKERLERQVAAQTEELRVQRAAIARTQRVLRTVARSEEEATEPAPKT